MAFAGSQCLCILCDTGKVTAADVCFLNKCQGFKYSLPQQLEMWHYFVNEHKAGSAGWFDGSVLFGYLRSIKCKLTVMVSWGPFPQSGGVTHSLCVPPEWIVAAKLPDWAGGGGWLYQGHRDKPSFYVLGALREQMTPCSVKSCPQTLFPYGGEKVIWAIMTQTLWLWGWLFLKYRS